MEDRKRINRGTMMGQEKENSMQESIEHVL